MAGASRSAIGRRPNFSRIACQPATTPGTVTVYGPRDGSSGDASGAQVSWRQRTRRPAAGIEAMKRAGLGLVDEGEQVAADAVARGLHQAHHRVGRDGGVDGVAAALEHLHAGARGQHLAGRDDAETRGHLRPARERTVLAASRPSSRSAGHQRGDAHEHEQSEHETLQEVISKRDHYARSAFTSQPTGPRRSRGVIEIGHQMRAGTQHALITESGLDRHRPLRSRSRSARSAAESA